jgi:hypothetical protein
VQYDYSWVIEAAEQLATLTLSISHSIHPPPLQSTVQYEYSWVSEAAEQLATLTFYVWTAVKFRPQSNNPYLKLDQSEIEL